MMNRLEKALLPACWVSPALARSYLAILRSSSMSELMATAISVASRLSCSRVCLAFSASCSASFLASFCHTGRSSSEIAPLPPPCHHRGRRRRCPQRARLGVDLGLWPELRQLRQLGQPRPLLYLPDILHSRIQIVLAGHTRHRHSSVPGPPPCAPPPAPPAPASFVYVAAAFASPCAALQLGMVTPVMEPVLGLWGRAKLQPVLLSLMAKGHDDDDEHARDFATAGGRR